MSNQVQAQAAYHARLGPSSAHRWMACTASPAASDGMPNEGNDASRDGTVGHGVAEQCLLHDLDPSDFLGRKFVFCVQKQPDGSTKRYEDFPEALGVTVPDMLDLVFGKNEVASNVGTLTLEHVVEVDEDTVEFVRQGIAFVREQVELLGGTLLVEKRLPIDHITGEPNAAGTSDIVVLTDDTLTVMDFKFGRVRVTAYEVVRPEIVDDVLGVLPAVIEPNPQIAMYAGGALREYGLLHDFKHVRLVIIQPPLNHLSEFTISVDGLEAFLERVKVAAEATRTNPKFEAGDHCGYCPARVKCAARDAAVLTTSLEGFDDVTDAAQIEAARPRTFAGNMLGVLFEKLPMIRKWIDDVEARTREALTLGERVVNAQGITYKLVDGRAGSRKWRSAAEVERILKEQMRLRNDEMYHFELISPTDAEKMAKVKRPTAKNPNPAKPVLGERQWATLQEHITQAEPGAVIALETDPRPARAGATSGFDGDEQVSQPQVDEVDLFN